MRAIIPVAGMGTRLRPHTLTLPKVLLNVAGKPILGHIVDKLIDSGIKECIFVIGYLGEKIRSYINKNYSIKSTFIEQSHTQGLGHAIHITAGAYQDDEPVLVILGDTIFEVDLRPIFKDRQSSIGVKPVEDPRRFGVAEVKDGWITHLVEKPEKPGSNLAVVGLYYFNRGRILKEALQELFDKKITTRGEYQLTDGMQLMIDKGEKLSTFMVEGWYDCGKPETVLSTNQYLLTRQNNKISIPGNVIIPPVFIDKNCKIVNSVIGPYATIAEGAEIIESVIKDSIVGNNAKVKNCILQGSLIGADAIVEMTFKKLNVGDSSEIHFN